MCVCVFIYMCICICVCACIFTIIATSVCLHVCDGFNALSSCYMARVQREGCPGVRMKSH